MKKIKMYIVLATTALIGFACNPIEDQSLRNEFENTGTPITQSELDAALSVTQPIPNADDKVEGDQYVVLKNNRPDIGGAWHYETKAGPQTIASDEATIIYNDNNLDGYAIYYEGISANQIVKSKTFRVVVTNCFDEYTHFLTGAQDKADKTAKKTWTFADATNVLYEGAHGAWKYLDLEPGVGKWWAPALTADEREQTMVFEFDGNNFVTYSNTGILQSEGTWTSNHDIPEEKVVGELTTTKPVIGGNEDGYNVPGGTNKYWILKIDEKDLVIYKPQLYTGAGDWDNDGYYFFFRAKE
jgi:hypothetical protein